MPTSLRRPGTARGGTPSRSESARRPGVLVAFSALLAIAAPPARASAGTKPPVTETRSEATSPEDHARLLQRFAADPRFLPVDDIRPGMTGYGLTVFRGTTPERFPVRVIGVLRRFLPQQDIFLVECDDPRLRHSGIVAGMSGSPIFLETPSGPRLAGALAYGWSFAKDPIAGVTPIANMLAEMGRPLRGRETTPVASASLDAPPAGSGDALAAMRHRPPAVAPAVAAADVRPVSAPSGLRAGDLDASSLRPLAVPLSASGFMPGVLDDLRRSLEPYGLSGIAASGGAAAAASAGDEAKPLPRFEPGGAIAVQLIRGDMNLNATGTVSWVEGDKLVAFGHPMFNLGEIYLPVATAEVHTVLASLASSFKLASAGREAGSLLQDRQPGIVADTTQRSDMIPIDIRVGGPGRASRAFHVDVIRHRFLTPLLASSVVSNAAQAFASDVADATITVRTALGVRGLRPVQLVDHAFSTDGFSPRTLGTLSGMKAIGELLFNPFRPANIDRIEIGIDVEYRADVAEITGLQLGADALEPGSRPSLRVTLRPYNGAEFTESVPFEVPVRLAGSVLKIAASAGNLVKPPLAAPERFEQLVDNLGKAYPARSIVVTVQAPEEGLALRGAVLEDLPGSVLDTLRPGSSSRRGETFKETARIVVPARGVVVGKQEIQVKVKDVPVR